MIDIRRIAGVVAGALVAGSLLSGCAGGPTHAGPASMSRASDDPADLLDRGVALLKAGRVKEAQSQLEQAARAAPRSGMARNNLGVALYRQHQFYEAAAQFQEAARLLPQRIEPRTNLGLVLEATGDLDGAIAQYEQVLAIDETAVDAIQNLTRCSVRRGERTPAVRRMLMRTASQAKDERWREWAQQELAAWDG